MDIKKRALSSLTFSILLGVCLPAGAETLVEYTFTGPTTNATTVAPLITANAMATGPGTQNSGYVSGGRKTEYMNSNNGSNMDSAGPDFNDYFGFTVQPVLGKLSVSTITFKYKSEDNGPRRFQVRCSLDGFTTAGTIIVPTTVIVPSTTAPLATSTADVSAVTALQGVSGPVSVRIYGWGALSSTRYMLIDDVALLGKAPAPGTLISIL